MRLKKQKKCYHKNMTAINKVQQEIIDEFNMFEDWMQKYEYIIDILLILLHYIFHHFSCWTKKSPSTQPYLHFR